MTKKISKVIMGIGGFIFICGISLMLSSMAFRTQISMRNAYLTSGLFIGIIGYIILVVGDSIRRNFVKSMKSDDIKRGN